MFNSDNPITLRTEDLLERDSFCKYLAKSILRYQEVETLTIGLLGKWGSGKTSIINLTLGHIDIAYIDDPKNIPIIIKFNPWNFSDQNNLVFQFFKLLSNFLKRKEYTKQLGEFIEEYSDLFEPVTISITGIPFISKIFKFFGKNIKNIGDSKSKDLNQIKESITKKLLDIDKKIIIIIDDIDRLSNAEVRQIFQLVKSLADFPNLIYILSFDKEIVCNALNEVQNGNGRKYIEKIIQVPIDVPLAQKADVYNLLNNELNKILKDIPDGDFDNYYWGNLFVFGMDKCFENIRDVKRFLNNLIFGFTAIKGEVNPVEFFAISVIQVFIPELYEMIKSNKQLFVAESKTFLDSRTVKEITEEKSDYENILKIIPEELRGNFNHILKRIFPKIELLENENSFSYSDEKMNDWFLVKRICHPDKFDIYFRLSLGKNDLSDKKIDQLLDSITDKVNFNKEVDNLIESGSISYLLNSVYARLQNIDSEKQRNILKFLLDKGDLFIKDQLITSVLFTKIANRYDDKNTLSKDLSEFISDSENGLFTCVSLVDFLGLQHSIDSTVAENDRILSNDKVKELENIVAKNIEEFSIKEEFFSINKLPYILYRWKRFGGEENLNIFLDKAKSDDKLLIKLINAFTYPIKSFGSEDIVPKIIYDIYFEDLIKFIDKEETFQKFINISNNEIYDSLTDRDKESIRLFIRNYEGKVGRNFSGN